MFGQKFIIAYDGLEMTGDLKEFCRRFAIGGLILFSDNYSDPAQLREHVAELQHDCAREAPLFMCVDQEGGRVQRFRDGFTAVPPMAELGRGEPAATEAVARTIGDELRRCGVNFNLAPVADLCAADRPGAIGDRSFSDNPATASRHVAAAVRGLQAANVMACAKHFPGHGATDIDSHVALPSIRRSEAEILAVDVLPFVAAIKAGVAAIMTAHAVYPAITDAQLPASLSPYWIDRVLRGRLGFDRLVITDALEMKSIIETWAPAVAGDLAFRAGTDIVIFYLIEEQLRAVHDLCVAHERGAGGGQSTESSLRRIARAKRQWLGEIPSGARL